MGHGWIRVPLVISLSEVGERSHTLKAKEGLEPSYKTAANLHASLPTPKPRGPVGQPRKVLIVEQFLNFLELKTNTDLTPGARLKSSWAERSFWSGSCPGNRALASNRDPHGTQSG